MPIQASFWLNSPKTHTYSRTSQEWTHLLEQQQATEPAAVTPDRRAQGALPASKSRKTVVFS
jgi:hypothetical protein